MVRDSSKLVSSLAQNLGTRKSMIHILKMYILFTLDSWSFVSRLWIFGTRDEKDGFVLLQLLVVDNYGGLRRNHCSLL
jgi:hypothetical protein